MMIPFTSIVMWTFGENIGNSWKKILWQSWKIAFIFSVSIEMLQLLLRLGTREFAEKYGVTQATVSKWCREGKIPNCNQDGKGSPWHIPKDAVPPVGHKRRKK